jgi:hypothetical protein
LCFFGGIALGAASLIVLWACLQPDLAAGANVVGGAAVVIAVFGAAGYGCARSGVGPYRAAPRHQTDFSVRAKWPSPEASRRTGRRLA